MQDWDEAITMSIEKFTEVTSSVSHIYPVLSAEIVLVTWIVHWDAFNSFQNWISIPILGIFVLFFLIWIHVSIWEDRQTDSTDLYMPRQEQSRYRQTDTAVTETNIDNVEKNSLYSLIW